MITPGAVKFVNFQNKEGAFTSPEIGSHRASGSHHTLKPNSTLRTSVEAGGEQLLFVWRGAIKVNDGSKTYVAGERDTVFVTDAARLEVSPDGASPAEIIKVEAPPVVKR